MENIGQGKNNPCFKVDQHSVLNGLNHDVSAVKGTFSYSFSSHCTFTKGTYHRQFGKWPRFPLFRL